MGFFDSMFGRPSPDQMQVKKTPESAKSPEASVLDRAGASVTALIERAKSMPDASKARGFMMGAAFLTGLSAVSVASEAQAHDPSGHERPGVSLAFSARGKSAILTERLAWLEHEEKRLIREVGHDESRLAATEASHDRRMRDEALPIDDARGLARVELKADERMLKSVQKRIEKTTEKRDEAAATWAENREAHGKVMNLRDWADPEVLSKLDGWGLVVRGNTIGFPEAGTYAEFDSHFITAEFDRTGNDLKIIVETTAHTYQTLDAEYDPKLGYVVVEGIYDSESDGRPLSIK